MLFRSKEASAPSVDFDLGATTSFVTGSAKSGEKTDFTPEGTLIMGAKEPEATVSGLDFDLNIGGEDKKPAAAPATPAPAPAADTGGGLDFDLQFDMGGAGEKKPEPEKSAAPAPAMDLSAISLDLDAPAGRSAPDGGDPKSQEVATKLDLAKAYQEMGDKDGARELLNEVLKDGDAAQKGQAQQLLAKLG